jgi:hypothetical protein
MFDGAFLTNEISQADNIKDKNNRKCVIRVLKMLKSRLPMLETNYKENGVLIFAGVLIDGSEVFELIVPPNKITQFYYECAKKFNTDRFQYLFDTTAEGGVIFIDGHSTLIYEYMGGVFKLKKKIEAHLVKRQGRGGSSSGRFMRIAEESRHHYVTYVIDYINKLCLGIKNLWIFGGNELKQDLISRSGDLRVKLNTHNMYHSFCVDTIKEEYFRNLMVNSDENRVKKIDQIVNLIDTDPDMLIFNLDELDDINSLEYIVLVKDMDIKLENIIKLRISDKHYGRLKDFNYIGKLYYKE